MVAVDRLARQIEFLLQVDGLKGVLRQSYLIGAERRENSAEHCWHTALMALLLSEHANEPLDATKAACMLLVHDIVEVDAGDTYCYDVEAAQDKPRREQAAADRLYALLPEDQELELRELWEEFEYGDSREARYARALDRLMPLLHNHHTRGKSWLEHGVTSREVLERNAVIEEGSTTLWKLARSLIQDSVARGYLPR